MFSIRSFLTAILILGAVTASFGESKPAQNIGQPGLTLIGSCMWRGTADAAVTGDYAYLAMQSGLMILDISQPSAPVEVSKLYLPLMWAWSIEVSGDFAYLIDYNGLKIINIADPNSAVLAGSWEASNHNAYDVALFEDIAVVAQRDKGIQIIDVSNPYNPAPDGNYDTPGDARSVVVRGNLAYVADWGGGLQIIDLTSPNAPDSIGALDGIGYVQDIDIQGDYAYLACRSEGMKIVYIGDPGDPTLLATFTSPSMVNYVLVRDTLAFVMDADSGFFVVDISNPFSPVQIGSIAVFGKVAEIDNLVFVSDWNGGVSLIDAGDPEAPYLAGAFETPSMSADFVVENGFAYGAGSGCHVIDLSDPAAPYLAGSTDDGGGYYIAKVDSLAYVSGVDSVFRIYNVADPGNPYLYGTVDSAGYSYDAAADGNHAYLTTWQDGLVVINTSDPAQPVVEARHMAYGRSGFLELVDDTLLFMEDVLIVNVADPLNPINVANYQLYGNSDDAAVADTIVYLASGDSELMIGWLRVVSIGNIENPEEVGYFSMSNEAHSVASWGNFVCVTDGVSMFLLDVSDPSSPLLLDTGAAAGWASVDMDGQYIYISGSYGFYIYQYRTTCGDANDDGFINVGDAVYVIQYVFLGGPPPPWICLADANGDGIVDVGDAVRLINYIFRDGSPPADGCCDK